MKLGLIGAVGAVVALLSVAGSAAADKNYGPGVTDTEIKIGQTEPYSGPASGYGAVGLAQAAYFKMLNEQGGINGRKITLLSVDNSYSPPKAFEATRRLVEQDQVLDYGHIGHAAQCRGAQIPARGPCAEPGDHLRRRRIQGPRAFSVDHVGLCLLPERGKNLRQIHSCNQAGGQDRGALPER